MGRKGTGTVGEGARGTVRDSQKVSAGSWGSSPAEGMGWEGFGMFAGLRELPEACRELLLDKGGQQVISEMEELCIFHVFPQQEKSSSKLEKLLQLLLLSGIFRFRDIQEFCAPGQ